MITMINGTTFYAITIEAAVQAYQDNNLIVYQALRDYGWDAFDISKYLVGSAIIDDVLYLCVTDGIDLDITGVGLVDPEEAISSVELESLSEYITEPTDKEILKHLTPYDLDDEVLDLDNIAEELLLSGYTFIEIVKSAAAARLIEMEVEI